MTDSGELTVSDPGGEAFYAALLEDDPAELYENAPCAYLSTAPDGTLVKANATFEAWTGYPRHSVVGRRRFQDLMAPGDRIFYETHFAPLLRLQGHIREVAVELVGRSGDRLPVIVNAVLKRDEAGNPAMVRTAMFDATERRAYERELVAARQRAEQSEAQAKALARTLQSSLLPPDILSLPGLDIGGAYRPTGDGSVVGGDFYDVFETGTDTVGVVLGDVCGKGPAAAVLTALARYTIRAEACRIREPGAVLARLHDAMVRQYPNQFCTALFATVTLADGGPRLTVASGGHHLPLQVRPDGRIDTIGEPGRILGLLDAPELVDTSTVLAPGDAVVLYTDGVTEARRGPEYFGDDGLVSALAATTGMGAQAMADAVVAQVVEFQEGQVRDDIAVVVIKVPVG
ncbi:MAG: SpoIIE family protein phosphatase [Actinomycetota bacterium]|nr:SpoIIE family protein phosphatase [Actinomycetota bacterium]